MQAGGASGVSSGGYGPWGACLPVTFALRAAGVGARETAPTTADQLAVAGTPGRCSRDWSPPARAQPPAEGGIF